MNNFTYTSCPKCHAINKVLTDKIQNSQGICGKCQSALPLLQLVSEVDEIGLQKLIQKSTLPMVVDFWAPWCGPCKSFAPTFELASKYAQGKMVFVKVNTEKYKNISQQFNIRGIPSLLIFKDGKEIARESGAFPLEQFKSWINQFS